MWREVFKNLDFAIELEDGLSVQFFVRCALLCVSCRKLSILHNLSLFWRDLFNQQLSHQHYVMWIFENSLVFDLKTKEGLSVQLLVWQTLPWVSWTKFNKLRQIFIILFVWLLNFSLFLRDLFISALEYPKLNNKFSLSHCDNNKSFKSRRPFAFLINSNVCTLNDINLLYFHPREILGPFEVSGWSSNVISYSRISTFEKRTDLERWSLIPFLHLIESRIGLGLSIDESSNESFRSCWFGIAVYNIKLSFSFYNFSFLYRVSWCEWKGKCKRWIKRLRKEIMWTVHR